MMVRVTHEENTSPQSNLVVKEAGGGEEREFSAVRGVEEDVATGEGA